jgi:hypothetical protein
LLLSCITNRGGSIGRAVLVSGRVGNNSGNEQVTIRSKTLASELGTIRSKTLATSWVAEVLAGGALMTIYHVDKLSARRYSGLAHSVDGTSILVMTDRKGWLLLLDWYRGIAQCSRLS